MESFAITQLAQWLAVGTAIVGFGVVTLAVAVILVSNRVEDLGRQLRRLEDRMNLPENP